METHDECPVARSYAAFEGGVIIVALWAMMIMDLAFIITHSGTSWQILFLGLLAIYSEYIRGEHGDHPSFREGLTTGGATLLLVSTTVQASMEIFS